MKKLALTAAAGAAALCLTAPAMASAQDAGTQIYGTLGYAHADLDEVNLGAIQGRLGARFGSVFGIEGELATGVNDDSVNVLGTNVDVELEHQAAIYGTANFPVAPNVDVFARVGYGTNKIKASGPGATASGSEESWNYGVGGQYFFDGVNGVRADYTRFDFEDSGQDADVWSIAYVRKF